MPESALADTASAVPDVAGAVEVVEAPTAEAAIEQVHERLGADARILEARRVLRGGIGGFFAREVVQVHAAPGTATGGSDAARRRSEPAPGSASARGRTAAPVREPAPGPARDREPSLTQRQDEASPVDRLLEGVDEVPDVVDFATFLRRQLAEREGAAADTRVAPDGAAAHGAVAATTDVASGTQNGDAARPARAAAAEPPPTALRLDGQPSADDGGPGWSAQALLRLGLPGELVRSLAVEPPGDDLQWTSALATALRPTCRPLPAGASFLAGPHAERVGDAVDLPVARSERFLAALRSERWVHLVVGGEGWRELLVEDPLAVSWARPSDLPEAIRCALDFGLVLGFGPLGGSVRRARPLDVALELRRLVDDLVGGADRRVDGASGSSQRDRQDAVRKGGR